jgi:hypothetical protein
MIQIDGTKRHVFLKFVDDTVIRCMLQTRDGRVEYRHVTGEISIVRLEVAGTGMRRIRITNLPPEVPERSLRVALTSYWDVVSISDETWSKTSGTRLTGSKWMKLSKHIPSHMSIAGNRVLTSYDGQPVTCYRCGDTGHV